MIVTIDSMAWISKKDLTTTALQAIKQKLTILPKKDPEYDDGTGDQPILLYRETEDQIGLAREYFFEHRRPDHQVELAVTDGDRSSWPGPLKFKDGATLRSEQQRGLTTVLSAFRGGALGGIVKADGGWGKTVWACSLIEALQLPTLVVVHKEFLMSQWEKRIAEFLPSAKVGFAQEDVCDFEGKHIVIGMIHSLAKDRYGDKFKNWPGLLIVDETHRVGAETWAPVPSLFPCRYRIGVSATPRRKDGADNVFFYHLGPVLFAGKEQRLTPKVKRIYTKFRLVRTPSFNPSLAPESLILNFLCASSVRNQRIVEVLVEAVRAGRKIIVLSKRINHLERLDRLFNEAWREGENGPPVSVGYYIGGMKEEAREAASKCRVIFATSQYASEGLDIPALDTLFLAAPMGDVEQAVYRICRPFEGKKAPIVVDFRDDLVRRFKGYGRNRDKLYNRKGWDRSVPIDSDSQ